MYDEICVTMLCCHVEILHLFSQARSHIAIYSYTAEIKYVAS